MTGSSVFIVVMWVLLMWASFSQTVQRINARVLGASLPPVMWWIARVVATGAVANLLIAKWT